MEIKHTNEFLYKLLQKNKIRPAKKSEVKWTEKINEENHDRKAIYTTTLYAKKDIKLHKFLTRIITNILYYAQ